MKAALFGFLAVCLFASSFEALAALAPTKVQITATKKRAQGAHVKQNGEGSIGKSSETASYTVTLKNITPADLANLTVDYIIFVERPRLGEKKNVPVAVERVTGSKPLAALAKQASEVLETNEITLKTETVTGGYLYTDGGRMKAEDTVLGIWVRVSQGGEMVGEFMAPASIAKQGWEKK